MDWHALTFNNFGSKLRLVPYDIYVRRAGEDKRITMKVRIAPYRKNPVSDKK